MSRLTKRLATHFIAAYLGAGLCLLAQVMPQLSASREAVAWKVEGAAKLALAWPWFVAVNYSPAGRAALQEPSHDPE